MGIDINRQLIRVGQASRKWLDRMSAGLSADCASIVTVRVRVERGRLHRVSSCLEEDDSLDQAPERRTGEPGNLREQVDRMIGSMERWHGRIASAMQERLTATYTLRGRVRDGLAFHVNVIADEDEPVE